MLPRDELFRQFETLRRIQNVLRTELVGLFPVIAILVRLKHYGAEGPITLPDRRSDTAQPEFCGRLIVCFGAFLSR
jgi:hypothetical protein